MSAARPIAITDADVRSLAAKLVEGAAPHAPRR
jgi:hypothetical protein